MTRGVAPCHPPRPALALGLLLDERLVIDRVDDVENDIQLVAQELEQGQRREPTIEQACYGTDQVAEEVARACLSGDAQEDPVQLNPQPEHIQVKRAEVQTQDRADRLRSHDLGRYADKPIFKRAQGPAAVGLTHAGQIARRPELAARARKLANAQRAGKVAGPA